MKRILDAVFDALVDDESMVCLQQLGGATCFSEDTEDKCPRCKILMHVNEASRLLKEKEDL